MSSLGSYLKREREQRQISVAELAQTTRIPVRILHQLETDEIGSLPADVFVRGFLRAYARALDMDEEHVLARYAGRQTPEPPPALPAAAYAPESGRRFGIAIALSRPSDKLKKRLFRIVRTLVGAFIHLADKRPV